MEKLHHPIGWGQNGRETDKIGGVCLCAHLILELVVGFALFSFLFFDIVTYGCQTPDSQTLEHGLISVAL